LLTAYTGLAQTNISAVGGDGDMATDRQVAYYKSLCQQLGQEPEDDFENFSTGEAREAITELLEILDERE
jgi:hypothetical protein